MPMLNLGPACIASRRIEVRFNRHEVLHEVHLTWKHSGKLRRPKRAPCGEVLCDQHPPSVEHLSVHRTVMLEGSALVHGIEVNLCTEVNTLPVEINAKVSGPFLIGQRSGVWPRFQATAPLDDVHATTGLDPCMRR